MIRDLTSKEIAEQYAESVIAGEIVACRFVKQACQKYFDERNRINNVDFPFYFDEKKADMACRFFPAVLKHSIGEWAGSKFQLAPWQAFVIWNLFGWQKDDDTRRFRRAFISIGRKNGKSTLAAGLAILLGIGDGEAGAQVYCAATKMDQAKIIFSEAKRMIQQSPAISKHSEIFKLNISFPNSDSYIRPLGSDKPFDGLSPHLVLLDELHAFGERHREFLDTMLSGSGSRRQPLQVTVTTAGSEKSLIYEAEAQYVRGVNDGSITDNSVFGLIFEVDDDDDPFDSNVWIKANPNVGQSLKLEYLQEMALEASQKPQTVNRFIRYHANRCVTSVETVVTAEKWDALKDQLSEWKSADSIGIGVDVGGRFDLASIGLCARWNVSKDPEKPLFRYEVRSLNFMHTETRRDLNQEPFRSWIAQDKLNLSDYPINQIMTRVIEECEFLGCQTIAYDAFNASQLAECWEQNGLIPVKMNQSFTHFNEVINEYQNAVSDGRFMPDERDEILRWAALNMALKRDPSGKAMPCRKSSKEKIDPIVAVLMAMRAAQSAKPRIIGSLVL